MYITMKSMMIIVIRNICEYVWHVEQQASECHCDLVSLPWCQPEGFLSRLTLCIYFQFEKFCFYRLYVVWVPYIGGFWSSQFLPLTHSPYSFCLRLRIDILFSKSLKQEAANHNLGLYISCWPGYSTLQTERKSLFLWSVMYVVID